MVITLQLPSNFSPFFKHFVPSSKHKWNLEPGLGSYPVQLWIPGKIGSENQNRFISIIIKWNQHQNAHSS
jgi:hypothetical protein